ncbi:PAS modulated sigma54 specific transcriptional regulator, Fis family [Solidesulfovibrio carbinoliphilus subsp. oakridgensis]|uniref:PAS modulated sigma54 specific transcriptional regulator, Fis family n=1 Tax=Solidesulfovibrio carbinoliphilus subsp. oakridgensis TaxID=694327 RepID=G7QBZ8_9BACT|nr:PAS domain S-box protein [Solidesulfovibrio carbinoliphilus]EHJ46033.1 PAS modulated sigma54 specific transcriptional regulator, Fis family [Solidesulfovibrio carbinoliphilus subsp. oakridgensis]
MSPDAPLAVGVVLVGDDGVVAEADAEARRMLDLDLSGVVFPRWRDLGLTDSVQHPPAGRGMLVRRDDPDGSVRWYLLSKRPLRLAGEPLYVFSLADVSSIKNDLDRFKGFFTNAVEGIFQSSPEGRFLAVNPALAAILGYDSPEDMIGALTDLRSELYVDPADRDKLLDRLSRDGVVTGLETRFYRKDRTIKWISQAARVVRDERNEVRYIEGLNIDITARKQAEEAYNDILERYRSIVTGSIDGVILCGAGGEVLTANPETERIFGLSESDLALAGLAGVISDADGGLGRALATLSATGRFRGELTGIKAGGETIPLEVSASGFPHKGGPDHSVWIVRDVADRKKAESVLRESEEKFRRTFDQSPIGASILSLDYRFLRVNDALCRITGYAADELVGMSMLHVTHPDDVAETVAWAERLLAGEFDRYEIDKRYVRQDGGTVWVHLSVRLIRDVAGRGLYLMPMVQDVTERVRAEQEMRELLAEKEGLRLNLEAIFRAIPDAIVVVDTKMRVVKTNRALTDVCFVGDILTGPGGQQVVSGACRRGCFSALRETLATQRPVIEYRVECKGQNPGRVVVINSMPLSGESGQFVGAVLIIRDITRLADLEKRLTDLHGHRGIIGKSKLMRDVYTVLDQLGEVDTTVLITGESGTGKELVAEAIHYGGVRAKKPLVKVNCSALSDELLGSELFGHVRGAFTGAIRDKVGRFEAAQGGTIFLDEIGDVSPRLQLGLLRVLESKEFERVGEAKTRKADVRVIAATNVDLPARIRAGLFRADLYYRLKVVEVRLPPLRDRAEDIPLLSEHFMRQFAANFGKAITRLSEEVMGILMDYPWPGNVRELKYAMEHGCVLCPGGEIRAGHLPRELSVPSCLPPPAEALRPSRGGLSRETILSALREARDNRSLAARRLGIDRKTLYRNMARLGIA